MVSNCLGDLRGHALLNLQAAAVHLHKAGNLADADDLFVGQISHMAFAEEREHVMLAETEQIDILDEDHLVIGFGIESTVEPFFHILMVPTGEESKRSFYTRRRFLQPLPLWIFTKLSQQIQ